jgi:hypothetical protein
MPDMVRISSSRGARWFCCATMLPVQGFNLCLVACGRCCPEADLDCGIHHLFTGRNLGIVLGHRVSVFVESGCRLEFKETLTRRHTITKKDMKYLVGRLETQVEPEAWIVQVLASK